MTEVRGNSKLVTTDLYPNIDLIYSSNQNGSKYYYIIKPGGNPGNINLEFDGASSVSIDSATNVLTINSSIGSISYEQPTAYQLDGSNNIIPITNWTADWQLTGGGSTYGFNIGSYDNTKSLVIQVDGGHSSQLLLTQNGNLTWSTNYGLVSDLNNLGLDIDTDPNNGNIAVVGKTESANFPVNVGVNQPLGFGGDMDGFILKFYEPGVFHWATFFGGTGYDAIQSVVFNNQRIYATGHSTSNGIGRIPILPFSNPNNGSYYKETNSGNIDAFVVRIEPINGHIVWSSYVGGAGDDIGQSITMDGDGSVFITGNTTSIVAQENYCLATTGTQFPLCNPTPSSGTTFFQNFNDGNQDIFITKFDNANNLDWSTFYGSNAKDYAYEITCSKGNNKNMSNIFLVGYTEKNLSPNPTPPYDGNVRSDHNFPLFDNQGSTDFFQAVPGPVGFISRFYASGQQAWSTTMSNITEFQTVTARNNDFYVAGYSNGATGLSTCNPISPDPLNGPYVPVCNANGGYANYAPEDQLYLARFDITSNNLIWSSLYPGRTNIYSWYPSLWNFIGPPTFVNPQKKTIDITTDNSGNSYLLGTGLDGIPTVQSTPTGAYYKDIFEGGNDDGITDTYILSFNPINNLVWATYFGTDGTNIYSVLDYPYFSDWCGAITTYGTQDLTITGYSGCGYNPSFTNNTFPWADPGNGAYIFKAGYSNYAHNVFISRFALSSIGVGINENEKSESELLLFPNPIDDGAITIEFPFIKHGKYEVVNMIGAVIHSDVIENTNKININTEQLESGCYIFKIQNDNKTQIGKFIKY
ncbi:MAG: T9SS type A sorting domain-containing protein [Bacteroidota bacterium]